MGFSRAVLTDNCAVAKAIGQLTVVTVEVLMF